MNQFCLLNQEHFQWTSDILGIILSTSQDSPNISVVFLKLETFAKLAICILMPKS